ncbi:MAG: hypothetical protein WD063_07835 [Pirellulales bacterium]
MAEEPPTSQSPKPHEGAAVDMPRSTAAPLVLALGIALAAAGWATSVTFLIVGAVIAVAGLGAWIGHLLPGRGHAALELVDPSRRALPIKPAIGTVDQLRRGMPGYRLRLPQKVHPISAGIKGGIAGGIVMPLPAMAYGLISQHGIWLPINLLAGLVLPGVDRMNLGELSQFYPTLLAIGLAIHVTVTLTFGLLYGVLLPTLPPIARPLAWGAVLMPLFWTAVSFLAASVVNPEVRQRVDWPWFIASQFVFGVVAAFVVMRFDPEKPVVAGLTGGVIGGALMTGPALAWGYLSGHGIWYPVNLLAVLIIPQTGEVSVAALETYNANWLAAACAVHAALSLGFGLIYGLLLMRLPSIPGPFAWGALLMPLFWTATSYALMGVVNPVLQELVDWPWFVVSQFVFGLVAAIVVVGSEQVYVAPAGRGPEAGRPQGTQ